MVAHMLPLCKPESKEEHGGAAGRYALRAPSPQGLGIQHGLRQDTTNQFEHPSGGLHAGMVALILGEVGGFLVLLSGFVVAQF